MRLPFSLHKSTKSTSDFVQLPASDDAGSAVEATDAPKQPASSVRERGASVGSNASSISMQPVRQARGRPTSMFSHMHSPSADMHLAQIEEELDTIMDSMGLQGDQRLAMKTMPADSKIQLIHTHKAQAVHSARTDATPLSEHLKILARAGTQSLPLARLEKLRVDVSYQSITQINAFVEEGGLRLLLVHLAKLNERRTASRRIDELRKELEILRCVLGVAKVDAGAVYVTDGSANVRRVADSLGTMWLPCTVMALRTLSYLAQQGDDMHCVSSVLSALFRRDSGASADAARRQPPFVEWMEAVDGALDEYSSDAHGADQTRADVIDFVAASLTMIISIVDALSPSLDKRVKFYEKLAAHDMLAKLGCLRAWKVSIIESHLNKWDDTLRRDYNIARSQRSDVIVLDNGVDSSIRSTSLFKSFVVHYEEARAATLRRPLDDGSDNENEFLNMNLAMYGGPGRGVSANAMVSASAPVTPGMGLREPQRDVNALSESNPFFASQGSCPESPAEPLTAGPSARTVVDLPFMAHSRSHSSIVAETGCLRTLRSQAAAINTRDRSLSQTKQLKEATESPLTNIRDAHALLQKSLHNMPKDVSTDVCQDLQAIMQIAQSLLAQAQV
ncbi:hypothetical protein IW139_000306 [Coemansia sp. RSA 353]|nr:hypothetical protein GGH17_000298 [Coemansia sp. RSA 788]KAJ2149246.1 hypothetical protein IW142_000266 [Coemansia sp. RSA 564]KAJ2168874.1 hypothetical protein GGH15_001008 [Coemansia sp. RSA 562]KAJ2176370.1 hypothetical protein GGH16_000094 [Coemansia sp. RSA 560]KAJ2191343.1 hypothetical protein EV181_000362 [Coemansia sp. RSA 532]KAJ2199829.1 hypothetical protein GGH18_000269 [Coemansia sp. RSA 530]KAJ2201101.1 hypothetical protein IW144_000581 [Coemansia sp. RSA 522]KAJ2209137.1 hyp